MCMKYGQNRKYHKNIRTYTNKIHKNIVNSNRGLYYMLSKLISLSMYNNITNNNHNN